MKQRFSSLDLQVIAHELSQALTNHRLTNIYDLTSRIFLLKFAKAPSKHLLLIDSGFRCHLTSFSRATATTPSSFVAKLRKCLRTRRVTRVRQIGTDRVLEMVFSGGEWRLYLEFYAGGNVVLVDREGVVVAVLRVVKGTEEEEGGGGGGVGECRVGVRYDVSERAGGGDMRKRVVEALEASLEQQQQQLEEGQQEGTAAHQGKGKKFKKKKKKKGDEGVKKVLSSRISEFSPTLVEHCFRVVGVDLELKAEEALKDESQIDAIVAAFAEAERMIKGIMEDKDGGVKGYIIARQPRQHSEAAAAAGGYKREKGAKKKNVSFGGAGGEAAVVEEEEANKGVTFGSSEAVEEEQQVEKVQEEGEGKGMVYDDFFPFLPKQYEDAPGVKCLEFTGFNHTVDTFFSSIESQKLTSRIAEREIAATKRLATAHADHARRVEGLRGLQELNVAKAQAVEANLERVEEVIKAMNSLVAQGMDWVAMGQLVEGEKKRGNPVAELIKLPLRLFENTVTVTLGEGGGGESDSDDDDESVEDAGDSEEEEETTAAARERKAAAKTLDIDIDLSLTAYANASLYFSQKKTLLIKESKTIQSSTKALKSTERKIAADLKKGLKQEKEILRPVRKSLWFEKFLFFISSDGYLVLAGRDLEQNEILYKRYFRRGDVYVSADEDGAAVAIVRNRAEAPGAPIPPSTLNQAGALAVASSRAWERKSLVSAWWVGFDQVGKTLSGGGYLPVGVFEVRGGKNFLPPAQLLLGYGVLWMVDEEGRRRHGKFRMEKGGVEGDGEAVEVAKEEEVEGEDEGEEEEVEEEEEESDEEEFPDAKIESAGEEADGGDPEAEESENEEFPDAEVKEKEEDPEDEAASEGEQEGTEETDSISSPAPRSGAATPLGSKHLSAKERRELKKARITGVPVSQPPKTSSPVSKPKPKPTAPTPKPEQQTVRGKKGKQKKQALKYAHQDAEDRALALELLGSASTSAKADEAATLKATRDAELAATKARRREQHARAAREGLKAEEARRRENPDGGDNNAEEEEEDPSVKIPLDCFVGTPMVGDNLLEAIPVCAPWGAMGRFKYKAKMQPGGVKKRKAVQEIVGRWLAEGEKKGLGLETERMWPREQELIKGWKEAEIINCVSVSKVKVFGGSSGGGGGAGKGRSSGGKRGGRGGKRK